MNLLTFTTSRVVSAHLCYHLVYYFNEWHSCYFPPQVQPESVIFLLHIGPLQKEYFCTEGAVLLLLWEKLNKRRELQNWVLKISGIG